jgi:uncharacterized membrane protein YfcA
VTAFIGVYTGAAGGIMLLAIMALVMAPTALIPVHTVVMLGAGVTRTMIMWRHVMRPTLLPFIVGSVIGAALGGKLVISLPTSTLLGVLGAFVLLVTWMPRLGRIGAERGRFLFLGFGVTFLGMFVSATGTLIAPIIAHASPDRRNHAATMGALMCISHISKIVAFGVLGVAIAAYAPLIAAMIGTATLGSWIGGKALNRVPERAFRVVFQVLLTALALRLLWVAASSSGLF